MLGPWRWSRWRSVVGELVSPGGAAHSAVAAAVKEAARAQQQADDHDGQPGPHHPREHAAGLRDESARRVVLLLHVDEHVLEILMGETLLGELVPMVIFYAFAPPFAAALQTKVGALVIECTRLVEPYLFSNLSDLAIPFLL